jgi:hypothetical protein
MIFKVQPRQHNIPTKATDPTVILVQDSWDDYGYKTTFGATVITEAGALELGSVKILRADQQGGLTPMDREFAALSEQYCSLGQTQSYYELLRTLGDEICKNVLTGLRDAATNPKILTDFEHLEGFKNSLIRSSVAERVLIDIPVFFHDSVRSDEFHEQVQTGFVTTVGGNRFPFNLEFSSGGEIPGRISVLIGYNGSGKTRLLANVAMLTATPESDRQDERFTFKYGQVIRKFPFGGTFVSVRAAPC